LQVQQPRHQAIGQREKTGFYATNRRWIKPLITAFTLLAVPTVIQAFTAIDVPYLLAICAVFAFVAVVVASFKARVTDTPAAELIARSATLTLLLWAGVKMAEFWG
jgi:hypothetical protein